MPVCDVCGKIVKDIRRHKERGRCGKKASHPSGVPSRFLPGTPEQRLTLDSTAGFATIGGGEPADLVNLRKRLKK